MKLRNKVLNSFIKRSIKMSCIFDVGANVGQSATEFSATFPDAKVFSFEPVQASFDQLKAATAERPNVFCHRLVLSRLNGEAEMVSTGTSPGNRIATGRNREKRSLEKVKMVSGDSFCAEVNVSQIDYLKIDAEGHDLEVLVGFSQMLQNGKIQYVQVECGLSPDNNRHVAYDQLAAYVFALGFRLYGFFDLMPQRKTNRPGVFYGNAVFVYDPA